MLPVEIIQRLGLAIEKGERVIATKDLITEVARLHAPREIADGNDTSHSHAAMPRAAHGRLATRFTATLHPDGDPAQPAPPRAMADAPAALLSGAGRAIAALTRAPADVAVTSVPVMLLPDPAADTADIAGRLRQAIVHSGLFYESHLAQWLSGERPLADLQREPQGRLPSFQHRASDAQATLPGGDDMANPLPPDPRGTSHESVAEEVRLPAHPATLALIQQQLTALETHGLAWQGLAWPGQRVEWEIGEWQGRGQEPTEPDPAPCWFTRIVLNLPHLGPVEATARFSSSGLHLMLTAEPPALATLRAAGPSLATRLAAAGIRIAGIEEAVHGHH